MDEKKLNALADQVSDYLTVIGCQIELSLIELRSEDCEDNCQNHCQNNEEELWIRAYLERAQEAIPLLISANKELVETALGREVS